MSIRSISSNVCSPSATSQVRQDFNLLTSDLQSNNLAGAQQDFASLMQDVSQVQGQTPGANAPAAKSLNSLSTALQSGNLTGAQTAMASLQQALHGHHHHHHPHGGASPSPSTTVPAAGNPNTSVGSPTGGVSPIPTI